MTIFIRGRRLRPRPEPGVAALRRALRAGAALRPALEMDGAPRELPRGPGDLPAALRLGSEFMPPLYEGSLLYMPTAPPGMAITEGARIMQVQDKLLQRVPGGRARLRQIGRATTATDNSPMGMVNTDDHA